MENKKTLILSILGVLVLIIAVVGVSFAMYSFSATGTRENVIETGSVSLSFNHEGYCTVDYKYNQTDCEAAGGAWVEPNEILLTNEYPKTDTEGLKNVGTSFTVVADYTGTMTVDYALQFVEITQGAHNLTDDMIKVQVAKTIDGTTTYPMGTDATGQAMSTVENTKNTLTGADGYVFDTGFFTTKGTITYTVKAWVDEMYNLYVDDYDYVCSNTAYTTAEDCAANGGTWTQELASEAETFTFKIRVVAAQRLNA